MAYLLTRLATQHGRALVTRVALNNTSSLSTNCAPLRTSRFLVSSSSSTSTRSTTIAIKNTSVLGAPVASFHASSGLLFARAPSTPDGRSSDRSRRSQRNSNDNATDHRRDMPRRPANNNTTTQQHHRRPSQGSSSNDTVRNNDMTRAPKETTVLERELSPGIKAMLARQEQSFARDREIMDHMLKIIEDEKAEDVDVIDVSSRCDWCNIMVIMSGRGQRHMRAIADRIASELDEAKQLERKVHSVEGRDTDDWMVVDGGSVCYHVFSPTGRRRYDLAGLWRARLAREFTEEDRALYMSDLSNDELYYRALRDQESQGNPATAEDDIASGHIDDPAIIEDDWNLDDDDGGGHTGATEYDGALPFLEEEAEVVGGSSSKKQHKARAPKAKKHRSLESEIEELQRSAKDTGLADDDFFASFGEHDFFELAADDDDDDDDEATSKPARRKHRGKAATNKSLRKPSAKRAIEFDDDDDEDDDDDDDDDVQFIVLDEQPFKEAPKRRQRKVDLDLAAVELDADGASSSVQRVPRGSTSKPRGRPRKPKTIDATSRPVTSDE